MIIHISSEMQTVSMFSGHFLLRFADVVCLVEMYVRIGDVKYGIELVTIS